MDKWGYMWTHIWRYRLHIYANNIWRYMEIYGNIWKYVEIYGYIYIYGNIWKYVEKQRKIIGTSSKHNQKTVEVIRNGLNIRRGRHNYVPSSVASVWGRSILFFCQKWHPWMFKVSILSDVAYFWPNMYRNHGNLWNHGKQGQSGSVCVGTSECTR